MILASKPHDAHNDRENAASHDVLYMQVMMLIPRIHGSTFRQSTHPAGEQLHGAPSSRYRRKRRCKPIKRASLLGNASLRSLRFKIFAAG